MKANQTRKIGAKWVCLGALTLAMGLAPLAPAYAARQNMQNPPRSEQSTRVQTKKKIKTYVGTIQKTKSGKYALIVNAHANKGWYLNDPSVVKKYVGQRVRIRGILSRKTGVLHVLGIHPAGK